jgi:hypothetical protein
MIPPLAATLLLISCAPPSTSNNSTDFPAQTETVQADTIPRPENIIYDRYYNSRFNYSVVYPSNLLIEQEAPTNNDGRRFISADGRIEMLVYGSHNVLDKTLSSLYQEYLELENTERNITYQQSGDNWFVVSGYKDYGKEVFYNKVILDHGVIITLEIRYDVELKPRFDSIVTEVSRSLQAESEM